jgi:hypothetical protein
MTLPKTPGNQLRVSTRRSRFDSITRKQRLAKVLGRVRAPEVVGKTVLGALGKRRKGEVRSREILNELCQLSLLRFAIKDSDRIRGAVLDQLKLLAKPRLFRISALKRITSMIFRGTQTILKFADPLTLETSVSLDLTSGFLFGHSFLNPLRQAFFFPLQPLELSLYDSDVAVGKIALVAAPTTTGTDMHTTNVFCLMAGCAGGRHDIAEVFDEGCKTFATDGGRFRARHHEGWRQLSGGS